MSIVSEAEKPAHMDRVRARHADPTTLEKAQYRADQITKRMAGKAQQLTTLANRARTDPRPAKRVIWMRTMLNVLIDAAAPVVVCRDGCDACCYQGVTISAVEAQTISRETGKQLKAPTAFNQKADGEWTGAPCPMLKDDRCSIYASRPIACRMHMTADQDDLLCRIVPGEPSITVPYVDTTQFSRTYTLAMIGPKRMTMDTLNDLRLADIRDYFD